MGIRDATKKGTARTRSVRASGKFRGTPYACPGRGSMAAVCRRRCGGGGECQAKDAYGGAGSRSSRASNQFPESTAPEKDLGRVLLEQAAQAEVESGFCPTPTAGATFVCAIEQAVEGPLLGMHQRQDL